MKLLASEIPSVSESLLFILCGKEDKFCRNRRNAELQLFNFISFDWHVLFFRTPIHTALTMLFVMFFTLYLLLPLAGGMTKAVSLPLAPFSQQSSNIQQDNKQTAKMVFNFLSNYEIVFCFQGEEFSNESMLHGIPLKISSVKLIQVSSL